MNDEEKEIIERIKEDCTFREICLLRIIEKLQKKNKELKKEIDKQKDINTVINEKGIDKNYEKALEKTMTKFLKNNIINDFISKQVEYLDNQQKQWSEDRELKASDAEIIFARDFLRGLLESEE